MKTFEQVGIVYHFTTEQGINRLIDYENLEKFDCEIFTFISWNKHISTTRGYYLTDNPWSNLNIQSHPIRIAFDGDRISEKFKIKPINGLTHNSEDVFGVDKNSWRVKHKSETEEVICPQDNKGFKLKDYILEIQINGYVLPNAEELKERIVKAVKDKHLGIDVNVVRKWIPYGRTDKELKESVAYCNEGLDVYKYN